MGLVRIGDRRLGIALSFRLTALPVFLLVGLPRSGWFFPEPEVVFLVGQDMPHEDHAALEEDFQDQPVLVAPDVDHHVRPDQIGAAVIRLEVSELRPVSPFGASMPGVERGLSIGMLFPEYPETATAQHAHTRDPGMTS